MRSFEPSVTSDDRNLQKIQSILADIALEGDTLAWPVNAFAIDERDLYSRSGIVVKGCRMALEKIARLAARSI